MNDSIDDMTRFIDDLTRPINGTNSDKEMRYVYPWLSGDKGAYIRSTGIT